VNFTARILLNDANLTRQTSTDCAQGSHHSGDAGHQDFPLKRISVDKKLFDHKLQGLPGSRRIVVGNHPDQLAAIHWNHNGNNQIASNLVITQRFRRDYLMLLKKKGPRERPLMFLHTIIDHAYWR
jgi:hypothetical protein